MKYLLITILFLFSACSGSNPASDNSYISIQKDVGGFIPCEGCVVFTINNNTLATIYSRNASNSELCDGLAEYQTADGENISLSNILDEEVSYDMIKISGPDDFECFPSEALFTFKTLQVGSQKPKEVLFDNSLDIYKTCSNEGC